MTTNAGRTHGTTPLTRSTSLNDDPLLSCGSGKKNTNTYQPQFGSMRTVLLRSLERHLVANEALAEAFRTLKVELETSSLNDNIAGH